MTVKSTLAFCFTAFVVVACEAHARVDAGGPEEHCRNVVVHNKRELGQCHSRCNDEGCRTTCREHERVARERHCWVD